MKKLTIAQKLMIAIFAKMGFILVVFTLLNIYMHNQKLNENRYLYQTAINAPYLVPYANAYGAITMIDKRTIKE